jgi:hypothetical protein
LGLEDNSKSDNKVLFFAPGSTDPVLYEGECVSRDVPWILCGVTVLTVSVGILKQKELSEFIVSVIKGKADLTPRKKMVVSDAQPEPSQDSEIHEDTPVHEEL